MMYNINSNASKWLRNYMTKCVHDDSIYEVSWSGSEWIRLSGCIDMEHDLSRWKHHVESSRRTDLMEDLRHWTNENTICTY